MLLCDGNHILRGAVALDVAALTTADQSAAAAPDLTLGPCDGPLSTLTPREAEVLRRIAAGQNTKKMAGEMNVTTETLRTYVKKVLAKLGAHSRLEAATFASRHVPQGRQELDHDQPLFATLTPREREVLAHLAKGSELRDVARQLHMSLRTANTHLQNLRGKLGVHSTLEAVALARARLAQRPEVTDPGGPA
jgi:DNA-binding NarL/FixJ family response regulator